MKKYGSAILQYFTENLCKFQIYVNEISHKRNHIISKSSIFFLALIFFIIGCKKEPAEIEPKEKRYPVTFQVINNGDSSLAFMSLQIGIGYPIEYFTALQGKVKAVNYTGDKFLKPNDTLYIFSDTMLYAGCKVYIEYNFVKDEPRDQVRYSPFIRYNRYFVMNDTMPKVYTMVWPEDTLGATFTPIDIVNDSLNGNQRIGQLSAPQLHSFK